MMRHMKRRSSIGNPGPEITEVAGELMAQPKYAPIPEFGVVVLESRHAPAWSAPGWFDEDFNKFVLLVSGAVVLRTRTQHTTSARRVSATYPPTRRIPSRIAGRSGGSLCDSLPTAGSAGYSPRSARLSSRPALESPPVGDADSAAHPFGVSRDVVRAGHSPGRLGDHADQQPPAARGARRALRLEACAYPGTGRRRGLPEHRTGSRVLSRDWNQASSDKRRWRRRR